jgi:hypothetical protein
LQNDQQGIEEFLQALNFIAPKGTNISYFITPVSDSNLTGTANNAGYQVEKNTQDAPGVTDTMTYTKKPLKTTHSFSSNQFNANVVPAPMPKEPTSPELLTQDVVVSGGYVNSPEKLDRVFKIVESTRDHIDVQLNEDFGPFKEKSLFHCVRVK